jgi:DNA-binding SARP family transcriptional activator
MALLHLTLLGGFEARAGDASPVVFARRKAQALLAYLAVDPGEAHLRDKLAALLWGESSDQRARHSLRQTLSALKQTLGRNGGDVLRVDADTVAINRAAIRVDVDVLKQLVSETTPEALVQATALYRGDFLEGFSVREPRFEEWLITERELLRELALEALAKLLAHQTKTGATQQAIQTAVRLLGLDPLQEAVHRALMRLYAQQGRRGAALRQYQICVAELQRELGQEPEAPTKRLYEEILQAQRAPSVMASPSAIADDSVPYAQPEVCIDASVSDAPLVGREGQMAALLRVRAEAWRGQARMAAVLGEAGIGKSRLIDAFVTDTLEHGGRVVLGRAHETERILPFGLWVDAFRTAGVLPELVRHPGLSAAWRAQLSRLFPEVGEPGSERAAAEEEDRVRLFEAMAHVVGHLAKQRPLVLALEDLHWADDMSLRLLAFVNRRAAAWPVLFLATIRKEEIVDAPALTRLLREVGGDQHFVSLTLTPLSASETVRLVRLLARAGTDKPTVRRLGIRIWRASEGNPFMVVETMRASYGTDAFEESDKVPTPTRVRDIIAARLDRLSRRARDLAALASVIGREFDFSLLERAAGGDGQKTAATVEELVARHILHAVDERLDFTHDRIREVASQRLLAPRRRLLHAAVAHAVEEVYANDLAPHYAALSRHCQEGALWDKALTYLRNAATMAAARAAHREAVAGFEQALAALGQLPRSRTRLEHGIDLRFALRNSLAALGEHAQVLEHLRAAESDAEALADPRRLAWVSTYRTNSLYFIGENESALASGERARALAEEVGDGRLRVVADFFLGQVCQAVGQFARVADLMRGNVRVLDAQLGHRDGSIAQHVYARSALACCLAELGTFPEALASGAAAVKMAEAADRTYPLVHACFSSGFVFLRQGNFVHAVSVLERGLDLCHGRDYPVLAAVTRGALGYAYAMSGQVTEALPLLAAAVEALSHSMRGSALAIINLGEGYLTAGRTVEAAEACDRGLALAHERKERALYGWALRLRGEIAAQSDVDAAATAFRSAIALAADLGMSPLRAQCHLTLGRCYRRAGRHEEARAELRAAAELFRAMESHWLPSAEAERRASN